jgi:hypothetical protein
VANADDLERVARSAADVTQSGGKSRRNFSRDRAPPIARELSASLRIELLKEIATSSTLEELTKWVHEALPAKNQLIVEDAKLVEEAFATRLAELTSAGTDEKSGTDTAAFADRPRRRDKAHLKHVAKQPCVVCGRKPSDPHHLRFAQPTALGSKVSDEFTVPLCRSHHRELHRASSELKWWERLAIEPLPIAARLWNKTHPRSQNPTPGRMHQNRGPTRTNGAAELARSSAPR